MILLDILHTQHLTLTPFGPGDVDYVRLLLPQIAESADPATSGGWVITQTSTGIPLGAFAVTRLLAPITATITPAPDIAAWKDVQPVDVQGHRLRVMDEATSVILPYLFATFRLQRIGTCCRADQVALIKWCERIGMVREGTIRHGWRSSEQPVDCLLFSMLVSECVMAPQRLLEAVLA